MVELKNFVDALKKLRAEAKSRKFSQSVDLAVVLREVSLAETKFDDPLVLPAGLGKEPKVCAFVDKELVTAAKENCDRVIAKADFPGWGGKKQEIKGLARTYDWFVAQGTLMPDVAAVFGKWLGPRGKMPNPKAGAVVPPKAEALKPIIQRLRRTVWLRTKKQPVISTRIGTESMSDEDLVRNAMAVYEAVRKKLPRGDQQIKKVYLKLTMSRPVAV